MKYLPDGKRQPRNGSLASRETDAGRQLAVDSRVTYLEIDPDGETGDSFSTWLHYAAVLARHKGALLTAGACGVLLGLLVSVLQTPLYQAATTLEVQQSTPQQQFEGIVNSLDPTALQTHVEVLKSAALTNRVYKKLGDQTPDASHVTPNLVTPMRRLLGLSDPQGRAGWNDAVAEARLRLEITPIPETRILQIEAESTLPQAAAAYVNTLVAEFMQHSQEERWASYQSTGEWLERAQADLKTKLEESERKVGDYASATGLVVLSETQNIGEKKLLDLQSELTNAQADRITKEATYRTATSGALDAVVDALGRTSVLTYETQLADFRRQLADATTALTPEHPKVKRLEAQIREIELSQVRERQNIVTRLRGEYEAATRREKQLAADFAIQSVVLSDQDQKLIQYKMLQREAETYRTLYQAMLLKGKETSLASAASVAANARVVDRAGVPGAPVTPDIPLNMLLGLFGGLVVGVGLVLAKDRIDTSVRDPGTVLARYNVRELGTIPAVEPNPDSSDAVGGVLGAWRPRVLPSGDGTDGSADAEKPEFVTWNRKDSFVADSYRATLTSILLAGEELPTRKVLLVTSPNPREGKSTVVTNLAIALAEIHQRILLIDADFRRPRLHTIFGQSNTWGLSDLLQDTTPCSEYPIEALARETHIPRVYAIPSGIGGIAVSRLIHSPRMLELLRRLRGEFDFILVDTPPVLLVPDARVLARFADGVLLVVRSGQTRHEAVETAARMLDADGITLLGTVLNDWNPRETGYGYGYHSTSDSQYYYRDAAGE